MSRHGLLRWVILSGLALIVSCTTNGTATVASASCYPDTDRSMDITKPTQFLKLTLSSDERVVARVDVVLFDDSGKQTYEAEYNAGPVIPGEPNTKVFPLQTTPRITKATRSCSASVSGYGGYSS